MVFLSPGNVFYSTQNLSSEKSLPGFYHPQWRLFSVNKINRCQIQAPPIGQIINGQYVVFYNLDNCDALLCFELFGLLSVYFQAPPTRAVFCMCLRQMVVQEDHWSCWGVWQCCELLMKKVETLWRDLKQPPILDCWLLITFRWVFNLWFTSQRNMDNFLIDWWKLLSFCMMMYHAMV